MSFVDHVIKKAWEELKHMHHIDSVELPYRQTYALPIEGIQRVSPVSYKHPRGAIGIVRFAC